MKEKLGNITHKKDMREAVKEINERGMFSSEGGDILMKTIAHWSEQLLQEYYGSSNYGYTITTSRHDESIFIDGMYRNPPRIADRDLWINYKSEVGFVDENLRQYKNEAVDWIERRVVEVTEEALEMIQRHEEQVMEAKVE